MSGLFMEGPCRPGCGPETDQTLGALNPPLSTLSCPIHPSSSMLAGGSPLRLGCHPPMTTLRKTTMTHATTTQCCTFGVLSGDW
ncbi:hypothetical protein DPEC_G00030970 [Dallia pectoralis]|uniref:Uncharacterized protein n=1 Tax=Dallia pectoralis TaxID=75939 RepID=A0ACC2HC50_DALPE|nr:hypothetical protein DPEC_G00030970 [Dallia pectoralis]